MPGTDGLLHVSEIANHRVKDVRDELKEGEQVLVKVINIDPTGKIAFIDKAVKPATSGQDIVTHLQELKVPERK
jgi:polyribonucleotide nucleotidyltransferase